MCLVKLWVSVPLKMILIVIHTPTHPHPPTLSLSHTHTHSLSHPPTHPPTHLSDGEDVLCAQKNQIMQDGQLGGPVGPLK